VCSERRSGLRELLKIDIPEALRALGTRELPPLEPMKVFQRRVSRSIRGVLVQSLPVRQAPIWICSLESSSRSALVASHLSFRR
jgi:hypothetical protein